MPPKRGDRGSRNSLLNNELSETQYINRNQNINLAPSGRVSRQFDPDRKSPFHNTPKTVTSTRSKAARSNIFTDSPNR